MAAVQIPCVECLECPGRAALIGREINPLHVRAPGLDALPLTTREIEVLSLVAEGKPNKAIARTLEISAQTVKNHITHILMKLGVNDRTEAVVCGIKKGWIVLD